MKKARSYKSKFRPIVPLDGLQSAIATAKSEAGRKRAASFLVRAAEIIATREASLGCCAIFIAHQEVEQEVSGNVTCSAPEGRLFSAIFEADRFCWPDGSRPIGWFWDENEPTSRQHRMWALLFAAVVMLDPS